MINPILSCDWLPERARWRHLACLWLPAMSRKKIRQKSCINPLLTKLLRLNGWLLALFCFCKFDLDSIFAHKHTKKERLLLTSHTFPIICIYFFAHGWLLVEMFILTLILSRLSTVVWSLLHQLLWLNKRVLWPARWIWWLKYGNCKCRKFYLHHVNLFGCIKFAVSTSSDLREHPTPCNCYVAGMFKTRNDKMTKMSLRLA